jgi:RNA polymerase sigma factor (sigma-70 family)
MAPCGSNRAAALFLLRLRRAVRVRCGTCRGLETVPPFPLPSSQELTRPLAEAAPMPSVHVLPLPHLPSGDVRPTHGGIDSPLPRGGRSPIAVRDHVQGIAERITGQPAGRSHPELRSRASCEAAGGQAHWVGGLETAPPPGARPWAAQVTMRTPRASGVSPSDRCAPAAADRGLGKTFHRLPDGVTALVRRARVDDAYGARALDVLLSQLEPAVRRFVQGRVDDLPDAPDVASDVTQETLAIVARSLRQYRGEEDAAFVRWVLAIARREALRAVRGLALRLVVRWFQAEIQRGAARALAWLGGNPADNRSFDLVTDGDDALIRALASATDHGASPQLQLVRRHVVDGLTWEEAAAELGTSPAAAKRRYQRAQAALLRSALAAVEALPEPERSRARDALAARSLRTKASRPP